MQDFQYFVDRDFYHNRKYDPKNESIFVVQENEWKNIRQKLTPTFTSAKMKIMFDSVVKCSEPLIDYLDTAASSQEDVDLKEVGKSILLWF